MPKPNTTELSTTEVKQPTLRAVSMDLFPTMGNLNEVVELAKAKFPVEQHNDVLSVLFCYHNTLLAELKTV